MKNPMILIISSEDDLHAKEVVQHLQAHKAHYEILDTSNFPTNYSLTIRHNCKAENRQVVFGVGDHSSLDFSKITSVWWRRPQQMPVPDAITRPSHRQFTASECYEAISGLWHSLDAHWLNPPAKDDVAHRKVYQLKVAQEVGLIIPQTCITSNPKDAMSFCQEMGKKKAICKAFSATWSEWRETRIVSNKELEVIENVKYAPVIFQEYIPVVYDLRITVIGDEIFPAAIYAKDTSYEVDMRMDINNAKIESVTLPKEVEQKLKQLMKRLGLVYGAIDMRLTPTGEYVFFEINPAGQWLFIEEKTKQPISNALAQNLINAGRMN